MIVFCLLVEPIIISMGNELEMCKQCQLDLKTNEREVRALSEVKKSPKASTVRLN